MSFEFTSTVNRLSLVSPEAPRRSILALAGSGALARATRVPIFVGCGRSVFLLIAGEFASPRKATHRGEKVMRKSTIDARKVKKSSTTESRHSIPEHYTMSAPAVDGGYPRVRGGRLLFLLPLIHETGPA